MLSYGCRINGSLQRRLIVIINETFQKLKLKIINSNQHSQLSTSARSDEVLMGLSSVQYVDASSLTKSERSFIQAVIRADFGINMLHKLIQQFARVVGYRLKSTGM